jgi:ABC-type Na+ efflux pump permease component-like protein
MLMRDIFTVMKFTINDMIKRKSFIISTLIILILIVIGFNVPNLIKKFNGDNTGNKLLIIDSKNVFEGTLENLKQMDLGYEFEVTNEDLKFEDVKRKIEDKEIKEAIIINSENEKIKISYIVENTTMMNEIPEGCINALTSIYSSLKISKLGLTEEQLQSITPNFEFDLKQTEEKSANGNVFAMMMMSIVLFYAIYFCAYQVSSSITTEKTSKIIETLVTSTSPKTIVLGKTIGIGTVGLAQMILIVAIALISAKTFLEPGLLDSILDMSNITPYLGIMTAIYFILGYLAYALLYALTGSTVSKPEDIQSANSPVAILAVIGFYLSYFTMMNPTSKLNVFASLFPISSPFCMPFRIMMGLANTTDVIMSIAILIATIIAIANIAIKIYSNAILNYGTKMGIKDIIKMYKDKQN